MTVLVTGSLVSRHFFRRNARDRAQRLNAQRREMRLTDAYVAVPARRGPFRWEVRRLKGTQAT